MISKKKRLVIYIAVAVAVVIIGAVLMIFASGKNGVSAQEHIDLGRQYLIDLSYDKAIIEFKDAIDIDPTNPEPYILLAEAYEGEDDIESAVQILKNGFDETGDDQIKLKLTALNGDVQQDEDDNGNSTENTGSADSLETADVKSAEKKEEEASETSAVTTTAVTTGTTAETSATDDDANVTTKPAETTADVTTTVTASATTVTEEDDKTAYTVTLAAKNLSFDYLADFEESGWAFAVRGSKGGYVSTSGEFVEVYDNIPQKDYEGLEYWTNKDGVGIAEGDGSWFNFESPFKVSEEGIYPYYHDGKWGYANINTGKVVLSCKYDAVTAFSCGRGLVGVKSEDSYYYSYTLVDANGKAIKSNLTGFIHSSNYINNIVIMGQEYENINIYDLNGKIIDSDITSQVTGGWFEYSDSAIIYEKQEKIYVITPDLKISNLGNRYDGTDFLPYAFYGGYSFYSYRDNTSYMGIMDISGKVLCNEKPWVSCYYFNGSDRTFVTEDNNTWYMIDKNGNKVSSNTYDTAANIMDGYAPVKKNGKWGMVNSKDELCVDFKYDDAANSSISMDNGTVLKCFKKGSKSVLVDCNGNESAALSGEFYTVAPDGTVVTVNSDGTYNFYKVSE